ncbi:acyl carrier protein [Haliangium ochraceum]|uniref:Acyl carrier protein n=1 Tax=Haliangium ochraceum (strain DSM 14365 / JCM 11303 / SMP-2) TaxID=502025 RepID=D0LS46_HALO1|nr:acyl carrier protein [Haliangium ochraceum]ACY13743.1 conserved hypothetical protein [Haliangium ochraceum DSM 14365]AMM72011.1 acyl carrier protein [Haliangium ochraceum DSM 14365]
MSPHSATIKQFLTKFIPDHDLALDDDIFAMGFVSSLFAMQLVMFVEKEFRIKLDNKELDLDNFRTVERMAALVERKLAAANAG